MSHNVESDQGQHCLLTRFSIKNRIKATKQTRTTGPRTDCVNAMANLSLYCIVQSSRSEKVVDDNFSYLSLKPYVVTPHLNHIDSDEGSQLMFFGRINKKYP